MNCWYIYFNIPNQQHKVYGKISKPCNLPSRISAQFGVNYEIPRCRWKNGHFKSIVAIMVIVVENKEIFKYF